MKSDVGFWVATVMVFINAFLFFASLHDPRLQELQNQYATMLALCSMAAIFMYFRSPR